MPAIAEQAAADLAGHLDAVGLLVSMETYSQLDFLLAAAFRCLVSDRNQAALAAKQAWLVDWATERGLLTWKEAQDRLGLTSQELVTAHELGLVRPVQVPSDLVEPGVRPKRLLAVRDLTSAERGQIAANAFLTRKKAAARLGITPTAFDIVRRKHGIRPVKSVANPGGWPFYLYCQDDICQLRAAIRQPADDAEIVQA